MFSKFSMPSWSTRVLLIYTLLSAATSVGLFLLFSSNSATVSWFNGGVSLGGPVAFFFAQIILYNYVDSKIYERRERALERKWSEISELMGDWTVMTKSNGQSGRSAMSNIRLILDDHEVKIKGGTFYDQVGDGLAKAPIGQWNCELCILDGSRLVYIYQLTDTKSPHRDWRGIVDATYHRRENRFIGTWQVFGPDYHEGEVTICRVEGGQS